MERTAEPVKRTGARWLRASRTVAPTLATLGCLIVTSEAIRRLSEIARWEARVVGPSDFYALARQDTWLLLVVALGGGAFGLLLAFVRSGRLGWSIGLGLVGLVLIAHWGHVINALPFLGAAALAWVHDDWRLHPPLPNQRSDEDSRRLD